MRIAHILLVQHTPQPLDGFEILKWKVLSGPTTIARIYTIGIHDFVPFESVRIRPHLFENERTASPNSSIRSCISPFEYGIIINPFL